MISPFSTANSQCSLSPSLMLSCLTIAIGIVVGKDMYLDWALAAMVVSPIMLSNMSACAKQGYNSI